MIPKLAPLVKELLPYKSNYLEVSGFQMHYLDEGMGPVIILLHGNPTWCFYYRNLINSLKDRYRVISPDFIGCGLSDHPSDVHFSGRDRIKQLEEFVAKLGLDKYSLVMHDWGGSIGTGLAVSAPEKIEKLVYLNTTLTETESLPLIIKMAASPLTGKLLTKLTKTFLKFTTRLGVARKLPKEIEKAYFSAYPSVASRTAIWDFVQDIPFDSEHPTYRIMLDLAQKIPSLASKPVQIIWGLKDPCFHREMLNNVAAHFPQAEVLEIPHASHLVLEDDPEQVISTIKNFFEGTQIHSKVTKREASDNALCESFCLYAEENPHQIAVIEPNFIMNEVSYAQVSFKDLSQLIYKYERGLSQLGLLANDKVLMLVPPGIDFLALSYAVMSRGGIPIFLDPGMGKDLLLKCIDRIKPDALIGSPKAQILRLLYRKYFSSLKFHVTASNWFIFGGITTRDLKKYAALPLPAAKATEIKLIAYTSGATGAPKGVVFTNKMLKQQLKIFSETFEIKSGKKDLPLLPIFSLFNTANGVCSVFPPINIAEPLTLDPTKILRVVNDLSVSYSFGSPTLWKKIAEYCVRTKNRLHTIEKIFIAGAPVPKETLNLLQGVMTQGKAYTPYGSTEALPCTYVSADELATYELKQANTGEQGTAVGKSIINCRVVRVDQDQAIDCTAYEIGEVIVSGDNVSESYFENPEANRANKLNIDGKVWHRMGDMAYFDEQKVLYFCGRKAHMQVAGSNIFYSIPVERIFNHHPVVNRSALIKSSTAVAVAIEPFAEFWSMKQNERDQVKTELEELAKTTKITADIKEFYVLRKFPVDGRHNAKIFRDRISLMVQAGKGRF